MNRKYPCDVIRDLLPGYIDGILSGTGTNAVREHLEECEECRLCYEEMAEEMQEEMNSGITPEEQAALDGFRKVRKLTRKLKLAVAIVTGLLVLCFVAVLMKVYIVGSLMSDGQVEITDFSYDEESGQLMLHGRLCSSVYRVSRVTYEESSEENSVINVHVYAAETLPFVSSGQEQREFTVTIPDASGYVVYLAGPDYVRREVYNWKHHHYELMEQLENEIYNHLPELDRDIDALSYNRGIETVEGMDGITYSVTTMIGDDAYYWWVGDQLIMHGDFKTLHMDIWISLEKPYQIRVFDYQTGQYTEDFSKITDMKNNAEPEELEWFPKEQPADG